MARPFFSSFLKRIENTPGIEYDKTRRFYEPQVLDIEIDCEKYARFEQNPDSEQQKSR